MSRRILLVLVTTALTISTVGSALAQEEDQEPPRDDVTVTFELTGVGQPPADATFFGYIGFEPFPIRLTDPEDDGVFTGSFDLFPRGDAQPFYIVQGTATSPSQVTGENPGEPSTTIKDFGVVTITEDTTLTASVSFAQTSGDDTPPSPPSVPARACLTNGTAFSASLLAAGSDTQEDWRSIGRTR